MTLELQQVCKHCGEEITFRYGTWYHHWEDGPDRHIDCDCHCAECDPVGGYTDGRECIDGCDAEPK